MTSASGSTPATPVARTATSRALPSAATCRSRRIAAMCAAIVSSGSVMSRRRAFRLGLRLRPQAEEVADRVDEVGAVHGVEVEVADTAVDEVDHLLGRDRRRDQLARLDVLVEPLEAGGEPVRHA